jgi:hypothetical protein
MKIMGSRIGKDWRIEWKVAGQWYGWQELIDLCSISLGDWGERDEEQELARKMARRLRDSYYGHIAGPARVVAGVAVHVTCDCCGVVIETILCEHCR